MKKILILLIGIFIFTISAKSQTVTLNGSGTDADGTVVGYHWAQVSGPNTATITSPNSATTTVTGFVAGVYKFELTVTDNQGATGKDTMQLTVLPANIPPHANAGPDQTIQLVTSTTFAIMNNDELVAKAEEENK